MLSLHKCPTSHNLPLIKHSFQLRLAWPQETWRQAGRSQQGRPMWSSFITKANKTQSVVKVTREACQSSCFSDNNTSRGALWSKQGCQRAQLNNRLRQGCRIHCQAGRRGRQKQGGTQVEGLLGKCGAQGHEEIVGNLRGGKAALQHSLKYR